MGKIKIAAGVGLAGLVAFGALVGLAYRRGRRELDIPRGWQVERDPSLAALPNAADVYQRMPSPALSKEESEVLSDALNRPWADPDGSLSSLLQRQAPLIALTREGAGRARFEPGGDLKLIRYDTPTPQFAGPVAGAKLLILEGRRNLASGRFDEASDDAVTALALARQTAGEKNFPLISGLVSDLVVDSAFPFLSDLAVADVDARRLTLLRDALLPLVDKMDVGRGVEQTVAMHGFMLSEVIAKAWYVPPSTLRKLLDDMRRASAVLAAAVADAARRNVLGALEQEIARRRVYGERPDSKENLGMCLRVGRGDPAKFGDCMIAYPFTDVPRPNYDAVVVKAHFNRSEAAVVLTAAAVRLYELAHHAPPDTLQALVPDYLPSVPADDFDGFRPLRYVLGTDSWTVYGIGPDRRDDGGAPRAHVEEKDWLKPAGTGDVAITAKRLRWAAPKPRRRS